jgi:hypothetical protein
MCDGITYNIHTEVHSRRSCSSKCICPYAPQPFCLSTLKYVTKLKGSTLTPISKDHVTGKLNTWHKKYNTQVSNVIMYTLSFIKISQLVSVISGAVREIQGMGGIHKTESVETPKNTLCVGNCF